jgi:hypothetical protein
MSKIKIRAAMGNAPEMPVTAAATTDLDSADSNRVHVVGPVSPAPVITITSFGPGTLVEKRVRFDARVIIHHNPPNLILLSGSDRTPNAGDVGKYYADSNGVWREEEWNPAPYTQTILVASSTKIFCPVGFTKAFIRLQGPGGPVSTFGPGTHVGTNGGYAEKTVQAIPGQFATLTIGVASGTSPTNSRFFTFAGASPPPPYPDTWQIGDIQANAGSTTLGGPGTATGGDVNITGGVGTYDSGTNTASMPAGPLCPAQSINSGHLVGANYGGGALSVDGVTPVLGGAGVCMITWGR